MSTLIGKENMHNASVGDKVFLASYTRVKKDNGMWRRDFTEEGSLISEKISKDEIRSMGFILADDKSIIDSLGNLGFIPVGLDYGDLNPGSESDIDYGNLYAGSESDIDYGDLKDYN